MLIPPFTVSMVSFEAPPPILPRHLLGAPLALDGHRKVARHRAVDRLAVKIHTQVGGKGEFHVAVDRLDMHLAAPRTFRQHRLNPSVHRLQVRGDGTGEVHVAVDRLDAGSGVEPRRAHIAVDRLGIEQYPTRHMYDIVHLDLEPVAVVVAAVAVVTLAGGPVRIPVEVDRADPHRVAILFHDRLDQVAVTLLHGLGHADLRRPAAPLGNFHRAIDVVDCERRSRGHRLGEVVVLGRCHLGKCSGRQRGHRQQGCAHHRCPRKGSTRNHTFQSGTSFPSLLTNWRFRHFC